MARRQKRSYKFQFHTGTIKSRFKPHRKHRNQDFNSTLVRLRAFPALPASVVVPHFNSTLVRLRAFFGSSTDTSMRDFNSTLVRLRVSSVFICTSFDFLFQFHTGTIKSQARTPTKAAKADFNSTLVRLRVSTQKQGVSGLGYFNSTLVRLRVVTVARDGEGDENFNSTLVRLRVTQDLRHTRTDLHFNSTLVRLRVGFVVPSIKSSSGISIPHWYD